MKHRKHTVLIAATLLLIVPLALFLRKPAPLDLSKDEEPFKSMALPPKLVEAEYLRSISVRVTDQRDMTYIVSFPYDLKGIMTPYKTADRGPAYDPAKIPMKDPARARAIMIQLFRDFGDKSDKNHEFILRELSGLPSNVGKRIYRNLFHLTPKGDQ